MSPELVQQLLDAGAIVLKIFGVTSISGIIVFLVAYYAFPPNLSVEEVKDKGKHNFESRLIVKNIGKLPAFNVVVDVSNMNFVMGGINTTNTNTTDCGGPINKLAPGEKMEIPAVPHVGMPVGTSLQTCDYNLTLKYQFRLLFFKKMQEKHWHVELRNSGDEFTWQVAMR